MQGWRHNWKSTQVANSHLVGNPTIQQPGFDLPRQQWSLLNRFHTEQGKLRCLQKEMLTYLGYTLRIKMLFRGRPVMVHDTHTR